MSSDLALRAWRKAKLAFARTQDPVAWKIPISDNTTALEVANGVITDRAPFAMTLTEVRLKLTTAPTGAAVIVDINVAGTTIMDTTKLSVDASEKTSVTAAAPAVLSTTYIADDAEAVLDIDQIGSTVAGAGGIVTIYGVRA